MDSTHLVGSEEVDIPDEPVRGAAADMAILASPGLDQLRAMRDGRLALPPNARLVGRRLVEVDDTSVVFTMPLSDWLLGPKGTIHPGALAVLGDSTLTGAVITALPPGVLFTTAELSMTFLGEMPGSGGELVATGTVVHVDGRHGLATAEIRGPAGGLLGFGTSRVFLEPPIDTSAFGPLGPLPPEPEWPTPDPWQRPLDRRHLPAAADTAGVLILQETATGARQRPPIDRLTGIRLLHAETGTATFAMRASPWLANEFGAVGGGLLALLAKSATAAAGQTAARTGYGYRALDVKVNFLRGVQPDGTDIVAVGQVAHRGRLTVANAEVRHKGRTVALATGTTMIGD
jgi:uncharacterized protein (TIGR00369 family)